MSNTPAATAAAATDAKTSKPRVAPTITDVATLEMPVRTTRRGSETAYPFDKLEVGQAFGVKNKTAKQMASIVSNQNRKKENRTERKDASGNTVFKMQEVKGADGTVTNVPTSEPETDAVKNFFAMDVDAAYAKKLKGTPLEGSSVLVFRDK